MKLKRIYLLISFVLLIVFFTNEIEVNSLNTGFSTDELSEETKNSWDENLNYSNGSHYHIHGKGHYYPGMVVPEPYATLYFPNR